jgi:hypothetical protein
MPRLGASIRGAASKTLASMPRRVEAQRRGQPADAGSYDDDAHGGLPSHRIDGGTCPAWP